MHQPSCRSVQHWVTGLGLFASVLCAMAALSLAISARTDAFDLAAREMTAQASMISREIEADLGVFDLALREAARLPDQAGSRSALFELPLTAQYVSFINVLNEVGDVVADSRPNVSRPANFVGRDYFQNHLKNPADTMMSGRPFGTAPNQHASIPISRRLTAPNGTFAGVVVAGVRLAWLSDLLSHSPSSSTVTVRRDDGVILMRMPFDADAIGRGATTDAAWQDYMRSGHSPASDGAGGLHLYRKSGASLLVVEIAQNRTAVLNRAAWPMWQPVLTLIPGLCVVGIGLLALHLRYRNDQIEAAARAANDERMRLLATMSHELRTPLTGILGQAELLTGEGGLSDRQTTRLTRLSEAGNLMRVILNRVTDVARPAGGDSLVLTSCDLDELIRGCTGIVESEARKKGLCLTTIVDPGTPARLLLAREYVQQVLINLLMNAVKYTSEGTVSLRVKSSATSLRLEVADTGPGVPAGQRRRLFRGYDRLDATGSREAGTGLGLSITDDFVHRMEGRIGHANNPSGGSLFWVELPIREPSALAKKVPRKQPASERLSPAETVSDGHALHILLVDDLDLTRSVTADFLRSAGHIVTEAPDGETAIDAVSSNDFDLVLTDMRMPIMDGLEATRRIRALPGHRGTTPIVLVTADLAALERGASGQAGVDHCLMKPFTRTELLTIVATAARVTSGPPDDTGESRVIDASVLAEMESRLGQAMTASHLRTAARRIEDLLAMLECPDVAENPAISSAAHDLIGVCGLLGLTDLSSCLRRFDIAKDRVSCHAALRDAATEAVHSLQEYQEKGAT